MVNIVLLRHRLAWADWRAILKNKAATYRGYMVLQKTVIAAIVSSLAFATTAVAAGELPIVSQGKLDASLGEPVVADDNLELETNVTARIIPTVWVDPDGCQHWVFDDGVEGYMTPHVTREGIPVCERGASCGSFNSDQLFSVGSANIGASAASALRDFFKSENARTYVVSGHTDSDGGDAYNMGLSQRRAAAVAAIAKESGAGTEVRYYGERQPIATNATRAGKSKNRRVEISCVN
jgi:outer membrane protein OmpA-like peptidoglycan-associated protein